MSPISESEFLSVRPNFVFFFLIPLAPEISFWRSPFERFRGYPFTRRQI